MENLDLFSYFDPKDSSGKKEEEKPQKKNSTKKKKRKKKLAESDSEILTVTDLTYQIRNTLEENFSTVWLSAEVSNVSKPRSGHIYLTLKDEKSQISAVIWRGTAKKLKFNIQDGMEVLVFGRITVYAGRGNYQIILDKVEPKGMGALQLAFEQLREKLEKEGLFDGRWKKPLPFFPRTIGIVTSPSGAAIRDMLKTIYNRFPKVQVLIYPVKVQGDGSAKEIGQGILDLNEMNEVDVLIIGRGGGSLEDLWAFNEEIVARAIFSSKIPVISAVGHEVDVSISDLVADFRAPTPTSAGEAVVPDYMGLQKNLQDLGDRIFGSFQNRISFTRNQLDFLKNSYAFRQPEEIVLNLEKQLDELSDRLFRPLPEFLERWQERLEEKKSRLWSHSDRIPSLFRERLQAMAGKLDALSPLKILHRGYSLVLSKEEKTLKSIQNIQEGDSIQIILEDGKILSQVTKIIPQKKEK